MVEPNELLRVPDVARRLGVHEETVRTYLRTGKLRGVRFGGRKSGWRVRAAEVERLLSGATELEPPDAGKRAA